MGVALFRRGRGLAAVAVIGSSAAAFAQPLPDGGRAAEIQRRQELEIDAQRQRAAERPDVLSPDAQPAARALQFPAETPCFAIKQLVWDDAQPPAFVLQASRAVVGQCVAGQGLRALQEYLTGELILSLIHI